MIISQLDLINTQVGIGSRFGLILRFMELEVSIRFLGFLFFFLFCFI
uniref:Uncharacterized protein n=1 Tax=Rhizophora mucronata TaxID=61149 RepID=A0A2P2PYI8_RHIMU